jgi:Response regulator containing a CheY-like receiver domain and an HTH DNA-binding domain
MDAFYVTIIFMGAVLVAVSLFLIIMDRVNGKDFFKEFDRKKDEMFNLIQDSEEMIHELNRMSDYVVTVIAEKNQEFFNKVKDQDKQENVEIRLTNKQSEPVGQKHMEQVINPEPELAPEVEKINQQISQDIQKLTNIQSYKNMRDGKKLKSDNEQLKDNIGYGEEVIQNQEVIDNTDNHEKPSKLVLNSRRKEVLQLIEKGLSNDEIAEKLKIGKGEIGLIRGLSSNK